MQRKRSCFAGHRPEKLEQPEAVVVEALKKEIRTAIADRFRTFIYGTARGVDLWVAEIVLDLRANGAAIRLICASPYRGFEVRWSQDWQERYRRETSRFGAVHLPKLQPGLFPAEERVDG